MCCDDDDNFVNRGNYFSFLIASIFFLCHHHHSSPFFILLLSSSLLFFIILQCSIDGGFVFMFAPHHLFCKKEVLMIIRDCTCRLGLSSLRTTFNNIHRKKIDDLFEMRTFECKWHCVLLQHITTHNTTSSIINKSNKSQIIITLIIPHGGIMD